MQDIDSQTNHLSILQEADKISEERQQSYGPPSTSLNQTAMIWNGILCQKLAQGCRISAEDVALCMVGIKLARESFKPKRDNLVDIAGWAKCANAVAEQADPTSEDLKETPSFEYPSSMYMAALKAAREKLAQSVNSSPEKTPRPSEDNQIYRHG